MTESSSSPGGLLNQVVKIVNTARYADTVGRCTAYNEERQRYTIYIDAATQVSIKTDNLVVASMAESVKFRLKEARHQAEKMANDPNLQRQVALIYQSAKSFLPSFLPPERLALVFLGALIFSIKMLGLSKTVLLASTLSLPLVVSLPDIVNNGVRDPKILVTNFPKNLKQSLVQSFGGKFGTANMDERVALAGFVVLIAISLKILGTPLSAPAPPIMASQVLDGLSETSVATIENHLKQIYQLGFQDASASRESRTSLTDEMLSEVVQTILTTTSTCTEPTAPKGVYQQDWDYTPPPKKGFMQKLGFATIMAGLNIVRTVTELGRTQDGFDLQLLMTNIKLLPPWRVFLLGLSIYRIVTVFLS